MVTGFDWREFLLFTVAGVAGIIALIPYTLTIQAPRLRDRELPLPLAVLISLQVAQNTVWAAREGKPLTPKQHPGSKPKLDERARRLVEADVEQRPAASLKERCRFVRRVVGVSGLWIERYDGSRSRQEPPPRRLRRSKASTASVGNGFEK